MNSRLVNAILVVVGAAVIVNGIFGRYLYNDAEMAMTKAELVNLKKPSRIIRSVYVFAGAAMVIYGLSAILHG